MTFKKAWFEVAVVAIIAVVAAKMLANAVAPQYAQYL